MAENIVLTYLERELKRLRESNLDHILELYFLETGGNLIDFHGFKKRVTNNELLQYLSASAASDPTNSFSDEELKELIALKSSLDVTLKPIDTSVTDSVLASTPTAVQVVSSSPSTSDQSVAISSTQTVTTISSHTTDTLSPSVTTIKSTTPSTITCLAPNNKTSPQNPALRATTRQHSISSFYDSSIGSQEQIVERARQEAYVVQRIAELRKNGLWSSRRLPKVQEPLRRKTHWDYLLEEMQWLATDFAQERKWKKAAAKKCAKMVMKYHSDKKSFAEKAEKEELLRMKRIASNIAKQIRQFWSDVEKVFEAKQEVRLKEKRKKLHDMHLNFIVDKADKYTEKLTQELGKTLNPNEESVDDQKEVESDFEPENSESDDEETIAKEEEEVGVGDGVSEIELLQRESEIPIEDLKASLPKEMIDPSIDNDNEFQVQDEELEDEEDTIEEEEEIAGKVDHSNELLELQNDLDVPVEQLMAKYYANTEDGSQLDSDDEEDMDCDDEETEENDDNTCEEEDFEDDMSTEEEAGEIGMEFLINPDATPDVDRPLIEEIPDNKPNVGPNREITDIAAGAERLQPKGNTLLTTEVRTPVPFLLKHSLREYQHIGLDWLVAMQDKKLNGILADEMGLGKTIQTIALIAQMACDKGVWGPHLIVVPTSVMLNWEMEFKKWCPAFKILTYYGSPKERKLKRQGWTKPNQFHVCITSYKLVVQDHQSFRRKKWKYLILDEAQHIKNFKSQRWQMLLNFNATRRLLLTGTPLQNNLMELWSLMHFLMPNVFQSHKEFKDWFVKPVEGMVEGNNEFNEKLIQRLHKILRPFLLRRLKCDVEKQLPKKYEHIIMCSLSKRQRYLYEEFMSLSKTKETLLTGNFLSVINILMQLRKVCNHPNLFDPRPTVSPLMIEPLTYETASLVTTALDYDPFKHINLKSLNLVLSDLSFTLSAFAHHRIGRFMASSELIQEIDSAPEPPPRCPRGKIRLQIRTSTVHSSTANNPRPVSTTSSSPLSGNRQIEQRLLMAGNSSQNTLTPRLPTTTTSSSDGNRMAIPLGRLVQTPTGPHILLRTSTGNPIVRQSQTPMRQSPITQNPMRQIIVRSVQPNAGVANSQEQQLVSSPVVQPSKPISSPFQKQSLIAKQLTERKEKLSFLSRINQRKCSATALYATDLIEVSTLNSPKFLNKSIPSGSSVFNTGNGYLNCKLASLSDQYHRDNWMFSHTLNHLIQTPEQRVNELKDILDRFLCIVPRVVSPPIRFHASHLPPSKRTQIDNLSSDLSCRLSGRLDVLQTPISQSRLQFPELRLIQYDCGKLQILNQLLWQLKTGGHRVLIFTQMSRMLDIFEQFLNHNGHTYLRLDGTTKVEQRQALMERFNADKRIFCFILSTRSGGIGVNLTGADTVIFYDSDWNPTMDAQAQDRCHRIGQTRDVHIYRLISEKTIEENILKKAQQKRLLGSVAIEGGNFTTAFFKQNAISELFGIEESKEPSVQCSESTEISETPNESILEAQLEQALGTVEEDTDVAAAKTARAEAAAEFAEFDENIPIDNEKEDEKSPEEEQIDQLIDQLTPVEKYAMNLLEVFQESVSFEQLKQAEEEIEAQKKEWELGRLQAEKEEALRVEEAMEEDREPLLTCHRDDAYNQVFISYNGFEQMPIWAPPTPPQDENDIYIDYSLGFLYEQNPMPESLLPPVYVPKESNKRLKLDATIARKQKVRKEEGFNIPRSLFDRPSTAIIKLRRELILQKMKGVLVCGPETAAILRTLNALGGSHVLTAPNTVPSPVHKVFAGPLQDSIPNWAIHEDWAIIHVLQNFQDLPLTLSNISPGHIPNWDFVSDVVNVVSCNFRSAKLCRYHYETAIVPREDGKVVTETTPKMKQKKLKGLTTPPTPGPQPSSGPIAPNTTANITKQSPTVPSVRPVRTSYLISQDNNLAFSQLCNQRFETIKQIANKRTPTLKHMFVNQTSKNPKHIALLTESGIDFERPLTPLQVAANRSERISREKQKAAAEQQMATAAARQLHQQIHQKQQQSTQIKTILSQNPNMPTAQHQLSQQMNAKISQINQSNLKAVSAGGMTSGATTVTQLSINKALSQVGSQPLPQPILSQISVNPQTIGTNVTNTEAIGPGIQQTCSVVSVAALSPQAHQKLIAAVSPVNQMGGQSLAGRLTNPQIYKQIILRQQQQQQQIQRQQQSPQIQMQAISQSAKQMTNLGVGQQQPRFQITATVTQSGVQHTTQSLIATTSGLKISQPNVVTTLPVAVPMTATQQRITTTTSSGKPTQQIITRTITDPQLAQIIKRQQLQQSSGNLGQTQILVQQSPQTQSSQSQTQILQNPVTFVKTLSSPNSLATQSLTIPITMTGMNIFTSPVTKVVSPTASNVNNPTSSTIASVAATQLRQIQLLQQKRPQQSSQIIQQQLQNQLNQQLGQQNSQKITTATIAAQSKGVTQMGSPMGTFQILHQSSPNSQNVQTTKAVPTTVTVQQLQQALKQGIVVPHNLSHTIHVSQSGASSTSSGATLIPQSILQAVSQSKTAQTIESSQQSTPIAVAQIGANQQTVKHIQVVSSSSAQNQSSGNVTPKSIIISGQPTILQTTSLPSQPQTVTFAIRTAAQTTVSPQTQTNTSQTTSMAQILDSVPNMGTTTVKEESNEQNDGSSQSGSRQSPYATRHRNTKN